MKRAEFHQVIMSRSYSEEIWRLLDDSFESSGLRRPAASLAESTGHAESVVQRWARAHASNENPHATGARSPLENTLRIFQWWKRHCPQYCQIFIDLLQADLDEHLDLLAALTDEREEKEIKRQAIKEAHDVAEVVGVDADAGTIEREVSEASFAARRYAAEQKQKWKQQSGDGILRIRKVK